MKNVKVVWTTAARPVPNGDMADHFVVGLGITEVSLPLTAREHTFSNVVAGDWGIWVVVVQADGTELAPPVRASIIVPTDPMLEVPGTITVTLEPAGP